MNASNIVSALLEGRPRTKPSQGQSAAPLINAWIDSCEGDPEALSRMKPRLIRTACICAKAVLPKVPTKHQQVCLDAIEAAEAWAAEPSEANRLKADKDGDAAWAAGAAGAAGATGAAWAAWAAYAAYWAYKADPSINFPARIAAGLAEFPAFESLL